MGFYYDITMLKFHLYVGCFWVAKTVELQIILALLKASSFNSSQMSYFLNYILH